MSAWRSTLITCVVSCNQEYGPLQSVDNPGMETNKQVPMQMLETTIVAVQVHGRQLSAFSTCQALGFTGIPQPSCSTLI